MRNSILLGLLLLGGTLFSAQAQVTHSAFDKLLQKHVSVAGNVNYTTLKADQDQLNAYLKMVEGANLSGLAKNEKMAFWINVYNAYTIKTILTHMPLKSITDIKEGDKTAWHLPVVKAAGKTLTLNQVEHEMLLKQFGDPRVHFAINCASFSCPKLWNRAFSAANLEANLEKLAKGFVNDPSRNKITDSSIQISEIFNWYKGDFTKSGTVIQFLNKYSKVKISTTAKVSFLPYNWNLNS